jgi:hypothetical protein
MSARDYIARLWTLRGAFRRTFLQADGKPNDDQRAVLAELRRFCYGDKPTLKQGPQGLDPYASIAAAARQEVYMRIASYLNLDDTDLQLMERNIERTTTDG